jgi:hypothetical protein
MQVGLRTFRQIGIAAWLGVLALAINAYVPVHLTYDLVAAINEAADDRPAHVHEPGQPAHHHGDQDAPANDPAFPVHKHACQVCATVSAGGSIAMVAAVEAFRPAAVMRSVAVALACSERPTECPAAYVSRAPPSLV